MDDLIASSSNLQSVEVWN